MLRPLSRRTFLRGTGVALSLPLLDAMTASRAAARAVEAGQRRRMVTICNGLGLHGPFLFPAESGRDYTTTPYLKVIEEFRRDFTLFSGLSHPGVDGGHSAEASFLTAAPHPGSSNFKNSISLDQFAAEQMAGETRFDYLALSTGGNSLSWTRGGVRIPAEDRPSRLFARLFLQGKSEDVQQQVRRLKNGQSILDTIRGQAKRLDRKLGQRDREKMSEYFSSVRDLERRLIKAEQWAHKPKPKVDYPPPTDIQNRADIIGRQRLMYDLVHLALQTDATRLVTLFLTATNLVPPIEGVSIDWHNLSHHGKDPQKIDQLKTIELAEMNLFRGFLSRLKETREQGDTLLDRSVVLLGSNLGNASSHNTRNLPILLAGGGFKHGQHLAFDRDRNKPLCNLYVQMLQKLGLEVESFASSTGTISGLT